MKVLFVCSGNIGRSQMAMEYFKKLSDHETASAGTMVTVPNEKIGDREDAQLVLEAMREDNIDMSNNRRTSINENMLNNFDKVVVMAELDSIPNWLKKSPKFIYWQIDNLYGLSLDQIIEVRNKIKHNVEKLINS